LNQLVVNSYLSCEQIKLMKEQITVLGIMSGSSCDGVDAAVCSFSMHDAVLDYKLLGKASFKFPDQLKDALKQAANKSTAELNVLNTNFSSFLVKHIFDFFQANGKTDYIASHGHTVLHAPDDGYTLQLGNGALISAGTKTPTIVDFRSQDIACGGQGAPLAPLADKQLFGGYDFYLNLGGIVNVSHVNNQSTIGFDIAPCNQMLNALSNVIGLDYDSEGKLAAQGLINEALLEKLLSSDYLKAPYPKSLDNSWVRDNYTEPLLTYEDTISNKLHTAVEFIAITIRNGLQLISNKEKVKLEGGTVFCTGGGAFNKYMMDRIIYHCSQLGVKVIIPKSEIIEYKEAMLMALMGYLRIIRKPNCIASVTGADKDCSAGVIYYP